MGSSTDGAVERRSLLRLALGAAVAVMSTACGHAVRGAATNSAERSAAGLRRQSPAVPGSQTPAPPGRTTMMLRPRPELGTAPPATAAVSPSPSTTSEVTASASRQWTRPAYRVSDVLPGAPANAIALTIDDGPHPVYTPMVLEVLRRYSVTATFSMIGINVQRYPQVARQVVAAGHAICNHSMWHPIPFTALSPAQIHAEIAEPMNLIWDATRAVPRLFRAPGGEWSPTVFQALPAYDLIPLDWDVDPRDWAVPGVAHIEEVLDSGRAGDILLCHDGGGNRIETVRALSEVIPALLARKLQFVTL